MSPRARRQPRTATVPSPAGTLPAPPAPIQGAPLEGTVSGSPTSSPQSRLSRITQRAYAIYERRGGQDGSSLDDWLQAEREIDNEV